MLDGRAFVAAVMTRLDAKSPADLAEMMGWKRGTERLVAKWLAGSNQPSYRYMLEMIERAGWLSLAGSAPRLEAEGPMGSLERRLEEVRALVERQGKATTRTLKALEAQTLHIRGLLEPPAQEATEGQD